MDNLILSFKVVMPLFTMMVLGYFLKIVHIFDEHTLKKLNKAVFNLFLPLLIIYNLYTSEIAEVFNPKLILYSIITILIVCVISFLVVPMLEKDNRKRGVLIQGIFRSNFVIFGMPLAASLMDESAMGTTAVMVAIIVPVFNFLAVIALEVFRGGKPDVKKIVKGIVTNPLIISSAIGLLILFSRLRFPDFIEGTVRDVAKISTPLALMALGGSIELNQIKGNIKEIIIGVVGKLVIVPAFILFGGAFIGFRGAEMAILVAFSASPVAVSSYTMAQQMGGDDVLAAQLQMFGTVLSIITVFFWIFIVKQLGYM